MTELEYWKQRCELSEKYIEETPCDPDIYDEQIVAYNNWTEFKKLPIPVVTNRLLTIDKSVTILEKVLSECTKFDSDAEKTDFILDLVDGYKQELNGC